MKTTDYVGEKIKVLISVLNILFKNSVYRMVSLLIWNQIQKEPKQL